MRLRSRTPLLLILLAALWFELCRHLSNEWATNEQYNYGWFVPFFAGYLFWLRWNDRPPPQAARGNFFLAVSVAALALLLPIRVFEIGNPDWRPLSWLHAMVVVCFTLAILWKIGGRPWLRHFAFPVLFFLVAVPWVSPIEQPLVQGLMRFVAAVATETMGLFGFPAQLEGSTIRVASGLVGVNEACSGVRSLQTSIMIALLFGELKRLNVARRFVLLGVALFAALLANCARAFFLVWIAATQSTAAVDRWHDLAGYLIVVIVFAVCVGFAALLSRKAESPKVELRLPIAEFRFPSALICVPLAWLVFAEAASELWYRSHELNLEPRERWSVRWPESAAGFRELRIDENVRSTLRFDEGREAQWLGNFAPAGDGNSELADNSRAGLTSCSLFFFRWNAGTATILRARAHRPDICLPNTGWRQIADDGVRDYLIAKSFTLPFRHFTFTHEPTAMQPRRAFADAFFCLREDFVRESKTGVAQFDPTSKTPSDWQSYDRLKVVLEGLRNPGQQVMEFVAISAAPISRDAAEKSFAALAPNLIQLTAATTPPATTR